MPRGCAPAAPRTGRWRYSTSGSRTARAAVVGTGPDPTVLADRTAEGFGGDDADELVLRAILEALPADAPRSGPGP